MKTAAALGIALVAVIAGVVFFWPAPASGPEAINYGRDACASCRMVASQKYMAEPFLMARLDWQPRASISGESSGDGCAAFMPPSTEHPWASVPFAYSRHFQRVASRATWWNLSQFQTSFNIL